MSDLTATDVAPSSAHARARPLGIAMLACVAFAAVVFAAFHLLRRDVDPMTTSMSVYQVGPYGLAATFAFLAIAASAALAAYALLRVGPAQGRRWVAPTLLGVMAAGFAVIAFFPPDVGPDVTTTSGAIHNLGGLVSLAFGAAGMITASVRFRKDPRWRPIATASLVLGILLPISLVALVLSPSSVEGLVDRVGPPTLAGIWFAIVGVRLATSL